MTIERHGTLAAGKEARGDSTFQAQNYAATKAVDDNPDTFWAAGPGTTAGRLEVDLGDASLISIVDFSEPIALGERSSKYHVEIQARPEERPESVPPFDSRQLDRANC